MPQPRKPRPIKKGLGSYSRAISAADLSRMGLGWYYNWTLHPKETSAPGLEFVPMFWWGRQVTRKNLALVQKSGAANVLGFNEPDLEGQSNMTPRECLNLWPKLMMLPQRLGSPAPAGHAWLEQFMPEAKKRGLRVDFVCVHTYPDFTNPRAVENTEAMLRDVHRKYGLPVWLTEVSTADVKAWHQPRLRQPTVRQAHLFLKELLLVLERLPFVERYAWFADRVSGAYRLGSIFEQHAKKLTPLGTLYRDAR